MYEKFCKDLKKNYGENYEPKTQKEPEDLLEPEFQPVFHPPSWFKKVKNYALNVDY